MKIILRIGIVFLGTGIAMIHCNATNIYYFLTLVGASILGGAAFGYLLTNRTDRELRLYEINRKSAEEAHRLISESLVRMKGVPASGSYKLEPFEKLATTGMFLVTTFLIALMISITRLIDHDLLCKKMSISAYALPIVEYVGWGFFVCGVYLSILKWRKK